MSRKKSAGRPEPEETAASYYELKTKAVDDLVNANEENSPPVSPEDLRKYTRQGRIRAAEWVKVLLIKWWFAAAVCFFFIWGLGTVIVNTLDLMVIAALALGFVTDLLTNRALRFIAKTEGGTDRWMMWPGKGFFTLPLNVLHASAVMLLVYTAYFGINSALSMLNHLEPDTIPLGVEPILFGLLCMGADLLLIGFKKGFQRILRDAKQAVGGGR